jgi:hypothetical protein
MYKPWGAGSVLYGLQHGSLFVTSFVFLMGLLFKVDGVSSTSRTYSALSGFMVFLCVAFMAAWLLLVLLRIVVAWRQRVVTSTVASVKGGGAVHSAPSHGASVSAASLSRSSGDDGRGGGSAGVVIGRGDGVSGDGSGDCRGGGGDAKASGGDAAAVRPSALSLHSFSSSLAPADAVFGVSNPLFSVRSTHGPPAPPPSLAADGSSSSMHAPVLTEPRRATRVAKTLTRRPMAAAVASGGGRHTQESSEDPHPVGDTVLCEGEGSSTA